MQQKTNKIRLSLVGTPAAPKLFYALQIAFGICGDWQKVIVLGSSPSDIQYQHMGAYSNLSIPADATPQRYSDLLNLCAGCNKEVIIFSSLSEEWKSVTQHLNSSYYEEVLKAHRLLFNSMRRSPVNIIACVDTQKKFNYRDSEGKPKLNFSSQPIQYQGFEKNFTTVLQMDKKGRTTVVKDLSKTLPVQAFQISPQVGAMLQDWCYKGEPMVSQEIQQKINVCNSLSELYQLLFDLDIEEGELFQAFAKRRLELDSLYMDKDAHQAKSQLEIVPGGLQ